LSNGGLISGAFSSDTTLSTPVAINKGGTGQTTSQAALDALAAASGSLVQGDVFIVDSSGNVVRLARGSDNQTLMMSGSNPNWETVSAGGATVTTQDITPTNGQTETSTSFEDVANASITLPTRTGGVAFISAMATILCSAVTNVGIGIYHGGSLQEIQQLITNTALAEYSISVTAMQALDGSEVKMQWKGGTGTKTMVNVSDYYSSRLQTYEVS